jgi:hypothetical protein
MAVEASAVATRDTSDKTTSKKPDTQIIDLIKEWQDARTAGTTLTKPTEPLTIDFKDPIYHNQMNEDLNNLTKDVNQAKPNQQDVAKDFAAVQKDSQYWTTHEQGNTTAQPVTTDLSNETKQTQATLQDWKDGKITAAQAQTQLEKSTADVKDDLNTLQNVDWHERNDGSSKGTSPGTPGKPGTPGDPGSPGTPLKDQSTYANMQQGSWRVNDVASEIGGTGIDPNFDVTHNADGSMTAKFSGGGYTDGLLTKTEAYNPKDNTVQLNYDVNVKPGSNLHALESDIAITNSEGKTAMAASQFVYNPKTHMAEFDTSDSNHHWVKAAEVAVPDDGQPMSVSMDVKMVGNTYEYTGLTVNGKTIALDPNETKFNMTQIGPKGWARNTIVTQLQQDEGSAPKGEITSSTVTYNDVHINQGNTGDTTSSTSNTTGG